MPSVPTDTRLTGSYASVMADRVERTAGPPPARRPGPIQVRGIAPGAGGPTEDVVVQSPGAPDTPATPASTSPGLRDSAPGPPDTSPGPPDTSPGPPDTSPGPPDAGPTPPPPAGAVPAPPPGWYRRLVVGAVVAALVVPAFHGALWFTEARTTDPSAGSPSTSTSPSTSSSTSPSTPAPSGSDGGQSADVVPPSAAEITDLLARRGGAIVERDRAAWLATVDAAVPGLAAAQGQLFDRLAVVRPSTWRYQLLERDRALTAAERAALPAGAVLERVRLSYRLAPTAPEVTREQHLVLVRRDRWLVASAQAGPRQSDPWDLGPVTVARGRRSVVVAVGGSAVPAERTAAEADTAAARVDGVWGSEWPRTVVAFVPADVEQMAALLGRTSTAGLDQLAAVTTGERAAGAGSRTSGDRVVINPAGFAELTATGRAAVLAHELTHVATRATVRSTPPLWVDEGLADYVAYLGTSLRPRDLAADLLDSPRVLAALRDLPSNAEFDPERGRVGAAYAKAWLAMRFIAQEGGTAKVVDFYRVATGLPPLRQWPRGRVPRASLAPKTPLERACLEVLGYVEPSFVRRWVVYVRTLARRG